MECPDDNALVAFVSNELDEIKRAELVSHLDVCETCMTIACAIARGTDTVASGTERTVYPAGERIVGRYRLDSLIGAGAMGSVYIATDAQLGREIAIKIVRSSAASSSARLSREARAMAQVKHSNVVTVFDAGDFDGGVFIVMELVVGETLGTWLDKPRGWRDVVRMFEAAGRGLAAAHAAGIVHRDFKPANVLVDRTGRVAVTDFGLAFAPPSATPPESSPDLAVTSTGAMLGTPLYMSPEAHRGAKVDGRADQFSFAVALYHALYGETPFDRESIGGLRDAVLAGDIAARPSATQVPIAVDRVIRRALAIDPEARYPTMDPLLDELAAVTRPRRIARFAVAGAAVAIVAVAATLLVSSSRSPGPEPAAKSPRVAVLFDRIDNRSHDRRLDGAVALAIQNALYDSTRIDSYDRESIPGLAHSLGTEAAADPVAAALSARDHTPAYVVSGSIEPEGAGFAIQLDIRGTQFRETASSLDGVLPACSRLAIALRVQVGDYVAAGVQIGTSSLDALNELALGNRLSSDGKFLEAAVELRKAIAADPGFADAHAALGNVYYNLLKTPEATAEFEAALRDRDRMTERRRLMLMSDYYGSSGRYVESIAASEQYLARWPGDMRSEVDIVATALDGGMFPLALELARRAVTDHPEVVVARSNLLLAEVATGKFDEAIKDGEAMRRDLPHPTSSGILALGIAYTLQGDPTTALHLFEQWVPNDRESADAGRADLAMYQGRLDDAYKRAHSWLDARKRGGRSLAESRTELVTLARIALRRGDRDTAREFATPALGDNNARGSYQVATILLEAGDDAPARQLADRWRVQSTPDARVYAWLLDGDRARARGDLAAAIAVYTEATRMDDSWLAHARLGVAELEAKSYSDAVRELEICIARRGEGAVFAMPSLSMLPPIYLALANAKAGLHAADATEAFRRLVAIAPAPQHDPLTDAARASAP